MALKFKDNASTLLTTSLTAASTEFSVTALTGDKFPAILGTGSDHFVVTLEDASGNREFIKVIHRPAASDSFGTAQYPCVRGHYNTTPRSWSAGDLVELRWSAGNAEELSLAVAAQGDAASIGFTPAGAITATNVQAAIEQVASLGSVDNSIIMAIALG